MAATKALKQVPRWRSDEEAHEWLQSADLSEYDLADTESLVEWLQREAQPKNLQVNIRVSQVLKDDLDELAKKLAVPTQRLIRRFLQQGVQRTAERMALAKRARVRKVVISKRAKAGKVFITKRRPSKGVTLHRK